VNSDRSIYQQLEVGKIKFEIPTYDHEVAAGDGSMLRGLVSCSKHKLYLGGGLFKAQRMCYQ
jgi:hypothetical protein